MPNGIQYYSTTAANNNAAPPNGWPEGQTPSSVNDCARQMMADLATYYLDPQWLLQADVPTYVTSTQFTVPGNRTATYSVGKRVKAILTSGTIYGTITTTAFSTVTTVTVGWDSTVMDSTISAVYIGAITTNAISGFGTIAAQNSNNVTITGGTITGATLNGALTSGAVSITGGAINNAPIGGTTPSTIAATTLNVTQNTNTATTNLFSNNGTNGVNVQMTGNGSTTPSKFLRVQNGNFQVLSDSYAGIIFSLDNGGNVSTPGSIAVGGATGTTSTGDVNITGKFKINGTPLQSNYALIGTYSASAVLNQDITTGFNSTLYVGYRFVISNIQQTTNGTNLVWQVSSNAGSTYIATGGSDSGVIMSSLGAANTGTNGATLDLVQTDATKGVTGLSLATYGSSKFSGGSISALTAAVNAIRFTIGAGTFSGTIKMYGILA